MNKKVNLQIWVAPDLVDRINRAADLSGLDRNEFVRAALSEHIRDKYEQTYRLAERIAEKLVQNGM